MTPQSSSMAKMSRLENGDDNDDQDEILPPHRVVLSDQEWEERVYQSMMELRTLTGLMEYKQLLDNLKETTEYEKRRRAGMATNLSKIQLGIGLQVDYPEAVVKVPKKQPVTSTTGAHLTQPPKQQQLPKQKGEEKQGDAAAETAAAAPSLMSAFSGEIFRKPQQTEEHKEEPEKPRPVMGGGRPIDQSNLLSHYVGSDGMAGSGGAGGASNDSSYFGYVKSLFYGQTDEELVKIQQELLRRQLAKKRAHDEELREQRFLNEEDYESSDSDSDDDDDDGDKQKNNNENGQKRTSWMYKPDDSKYNDGGNDNKTGKAPPRTNFSGML